MRRIILKSFQSPGDIVMLTAALRDLHAAHPGQFNTDVRTSADSLFENNPLVTKLSESDAGVEVIDMHYPLIHQSNDRPYHFQHGFTQYLEQILGVDIPLLQIGGDIHLSDEEKRQLPPVAETEGVRDGFWIIVGGGKYDFTAKWWNPANYQSVVDLLGDRIQFVQCGEAAHWHPRLDGAIDLVGKTSLREFVWLMHYAAGVICPVTFAMHLAAAVETRQRHAKLRPCVVIAGGREPPHWEAYPGHQFVHTVGALPCCSHGGCWKSRCQPVGDGDRKDMHDLCEAPVLVKPDLRIPQCMEMIQPTDIVRRVEYFMQKPHDVVTRETNRKRSPKSHPKQTAPTKLGALKHKAAESNSKISVSFFHGLGDCAYFAHLIPLYTRRGYDFEVECTPDKRILFEAAGATTIESKAKVSHPWGYPPGATYKGHGRYWQGSKMAHNISEDPLPHIGERGELWDEYCESQVPIEQHLSDDAKKRVKSWLQDLPRPVVLLHTIGNSGQERKSLPREATRELYQKLLDRYEGSLILLDWDNRVPRLASYRVRHLGDLGSCDTETMFALISAANLMIGVDSGPLHATRFTDTPSVGLWMPGHYPATYTLPRRQQLNIVLSGHTSEWNAYKRIPWNLIEHQGDVFDPTTVANWCSKMLQPPRYLPAGQRAGDLQLEQMVRYWSKSSISNGLSDYIDRHKSFDILLREMQQRFMSNPSSGADVPTVVETGTIRAEDDWGAGFFTYIMGSFLHRHGRGRLHSCDVNVANCQFSEEWTRQFGGGETVTVHRQDSVKFLREFSKPIDVLYVDSLDTTEPGHAEHALKEVEAALPKLHEQSLVLFDDTPWQGGAWIGKGARAIPWLLERGWSVVYGGYQVLLARTGGGKGGVNV